MVDYNNLKLSLISIEDINKLIVRVFNDEYIVGILYSCSSYLHKKKRFRFGGLFCEKIFGILYICKNKKVNCMSNFEFNDSPILNRKCFKCKKKLFYNTKRKYRFGAICLTFPIVNSIYFGKYISNLENFNNLIEEFNEVCIYHIDEDSIGSEDLLGDIQLRFFNFISLLYKIIQSAEIFKIKFSSLKQTKIFYGKVRNITKFINKYVCLKNIFILLLPVLPAGLRMVSTNIKKVSLNSKLNVLYNYIIYLNNYIYNIPFFGQLLKFVFILYLVIDVLLSITGLNYIFGKDSTIYKRLKGKYGIFRQNLLGFRVDYSGRATIIAGPDLCMYNIGLPFSIISSLLHEAEDKDKIYVKKKDLINYKDESVYYIRNSIYGQMKFFEKMSDYSIILNRAPTLHKMNTQSFSPIFIEGNAIKLMPLACSGYNADFDGDQMGVFSVLCKSSILESRYMLRSIVNLYSPTTKKIVFEATQGSSFGISILSNYNYFNFDNYYVIDSYNSAIELNSINNINVDRPMWLRYINYFYLITTGRLLLNLNV